MKSKHSQNSRKRDDIIIFNADKVGAIIILDSDEYIIEANSQLNNEQCYQKLSPNLTLNNANTVNDKIDLFKIQQMIPENVAEGLNVNVTKTPTLKLPPKVHKDGHLGRPLVSSIDSPTSNFTYNHTLVRLKTPNTS